MRPFFGLSNARDVSLLSVAQASALISAFSVVSSALYLAHLIDDGRGVVLLRLGRMALSLVELQLVLPRNHCAAGVHGRDWRFASWGPAATIETL